MKTFLRKICITALLFACIHVLLIFPIPADRNQYLQEYNNKINLIATTPQPRVIFIGGSNTAFGLDSHAIAHALHCQVVNFGLHSGIGLHYPMEDAIQYIIPGDIIVVQIEYPNFFEQTCNAETMPKLMTATHWRRGSQLSLAEWNAVVRGCPLLALSNLKRLMLWPFRGSLDTPAPTGSFNYTASGFNELGDEICHLNYPSMPYISSQEQESREVDTDFIVWLQSCLKKYEQRGATIILLPPACVVSCMKASYHDGIAHALQSIGYPYTIQPQNMVLPDSLSFNSGYHLNREGVRRNTERIIDIITKYHALPSSQIK